MENISPTHTICLGHLHPRSTNYRAPFFCEDGRSFRVGFSIASGSFEVVLLAADDFLIVSVCGLAEWWNLNTLSIVGVSSIQGVPKSMLENFWFQGGRVWEIDAEFFFWYTWCSDSMLEYLFLVYRVLGN